MTESQDQIQPVGTDQDRIEPVGLEGEDPKRLALSDGTALRLDDESETWHRGDHEVSMADAMEIAGRDNADYVTTRTRAEVAWLWILAEWCQERAERLSRDLDIHVQPSRS